MRSGGLRLAVTLLTAVPLPGGSRRTGAQDRSASDSGALGAPEGSALGERSPDFGAAPDRRTVATAMYLAPVVGLALGGAAAGVLIGCRDGHTGPLLAAVLAISVLAALTRALHLDGLADTADGLGSRLPAVQALAIMRRSDIGPFGVVTLVLTLLLQVSALTQAERIGRGPLGIVAATVAARLAITLACRRGVPSARPTGLGALVAGTVHPVAGAALALAAVGGAAALGPVYAASVAVGLTCSVLVTGLATGRLGGITGDVLGATAEIATTACLLVTAIG
jgi:adenosylcobinamide-GDP ribazoletransferase